MMSHCQFDFYIYIYLFCMKYLLIPFLSYLLVVFPIDSFTLSIIMRLGLCIFALQMFLPVECLPTGSFNSYLVKLVNILRFLSFL